MSSEKFTSSCSDAACHQELTKARWVHAPAATNACAVCHIPLDQLADHAFKPIPDGSASCTDCHQPTSHTTSVHEPFELGECTSCHDPHAADRKSLIITSTTQSLCASCHENALEHTDHHPVNQGDCLTCHTPHQSKHENLLTQSRSTLCLSCHKALDHAGRLGSMNSNQPANIHEPMLTDQCFTCHLSHGSSQQSMLINQQRSLCLDCHTEQTHNLPLALSIHAPFESTQACTQCHSPHSSDHQALLNTPPNALCFTCHNKQVQSDAGVIQNMKKLIEESPVVHEPARLGDCSSCHVSHFSTQRNLLREHYTDKDYAKFDSQSYAMCFKCHDQSMFEDEHSTLTAFRNNTQNLHFVHINREKGRSCNICHQPHASQLPSLIRDTSPFGPGNWDLPIGFTQTNTGGSCLSACHELRSYDRSTLP